MLKNYLLRLKVNHFHRFREQKGQSIIILAFAFLGLLAMLGLALDLGLVYIERVRVSRTTDAATLAGVVELPFEEEAIERAVEYIELNGYQVGVDTEIRVRGCISDTTSGQLANVGEDGVYGKDNVVDVQPTNPITGYVYKQVAGDDPPRAIFVIDTLAYQPVERDASKAVTTKNKETCLSAGGSSIYGTANKLRVTGEVSVDMNFMQFFGFGEVPVSDQATAENVTNLDVVVVFDVSGSMRFETNCFGCWNEDSTKDVIQYPYPSNGDANPLDYKGANIFWGGVVTHTICSDAPQSREITVGSDKYHYLVHEAEFYSADVPRHGWEFEKRNSGQGFWVLQRPDKGSNKSYIRTHPYTTYSQSSTGNYPQLQGAAYNSACFEPPYECWKTVADSLDEKAPSTPPWVEYDFTPDWSGTTYIWLRAEGGNNYSDKWNGSSPASLPDWSKSIYWQIDLYADGVLTDTVKEKVYGGPFDSLLKMDDWTWIVKDSNWRWVKLGQVNTGSAGTQHTLRLYQGSAGFNVDKIIFTNYNDGNADGTVLSKVPGLSSYTNEGPDATPGSATREACNKCNPAFGQTVNKADCSCRKGPGDTTAGTLYPGGGTGLGCTSVATTTNMLENDLFHGEDPLRSAQEAVKKFAMRLDPKFDQIGLVAFSDTIYTPRRKLQCLRYAQKNLGGTDQCYGPSTTAISYTKVISAVEAYEPSSTTNIAQGMQEGLEELGISIPTYNPNVDSDCTTDTSTLGDGHACDRRGAARRVLILMTDGSPNKNVSCPDSSQWRGRFGGHPDTDNNDYDCAMYFAAQAADHNVTVYTIGIGSGVNIELLTAMATGTDPNPRSGDDGFYFEGKGGQYFPAARPSDLDAIFDKILSQIVVRIVG